jgi:hypothetical protein
MRDKAHKQANYKDHQLLQQAITYCPLNLGFMAEQMFVLSQVPKEISKWMQRPYVTPIGTKESIQLYPEGLHISMHDSTPVL